MSSYNRTKYQILKLLSGEDRYFTPREIADKLSLNLHAVEQRLYKLSKWDYIWRKKEFRKEHDNRYCYKYLKTKGKSVLRYLEERIRFEEETGIKVTLNLNVKFNTINGGVAALR